MVMKHLFPYKEADDVTPEEKLRLAYNMVTVIKGVFDHYGYLEDVMLPLKLEKEIVSEEINNTENKLSELITAFYDERINTIMRCKSDEEVTSKFKDDKEILYELRSYLRNHGIDEFLIKMYVENVFEYIDRDLD